MKKNQKGITLIALVITIIVMLILVGVSISMAINGGLFNYAGKAAKETQNAIDAENELSNGRIQVDGVWYDTIDDYIAGIVSSDQNGGTTGKVELPEDLKVGDYVNYTPTTGTYKVADGENGSGYTTDEGYQEFTTETGKSALKWRVWSINEEENTIELISATAAQEETKLYLQGADGYNHAVDILNDLCEKLYSNEAGTTARSINAEDINSKTTYDYTKHTDSWITSGFSVTYGDTRQLSTYGTNYMNYPKLYSQELGYGTGNVFNQTGLNGSERLKDGATDETGVTTYSTVIGSINGNLAKTDPYVTKNTYSYQANEYLDRSLGINSIQENLIVIGEYYWVASRAVMFYSNRANFNIGKIQSRRLFPLLLFV